MAGAPRPGGAGGGSHGAVSNPACPDFKSLGVEPAELSEIYVDREVFRVLLGLLPLLLSPKENRAQKCVNEYECVGLHWTFLFMTLSLVCLPKVNVVFK